MTATDKHAGQYKSGRQGDLLLFHKIKFIRRMLRMVKVLSMQILTDPGYLETVILMIWENKGMNCGFK